MADLSPAVPIKPRRASRDIVLIFMWVATAVEAGFILWQLLCLTPVGLVLFGRFCNPLIYATPVMTDAYLLLIVVYAFRNEAIRWISRPPETIFDDLSTLPPEGSFSKKVRSGYLAVSLWSAILVPAYLMRRSGVLPVFPHELAEVCIRVFGIFALSAFSRIVHELLGRPILFRTRPDPETLLREKYPCLRHPVAMGIYKHALADGWVTAKSCGAAFSLSRTAVMYHLKKMQSEGLLEMEGKRRNAFYRLPGNQRR